MQTHIVSEVMNENQQYETIRFRLTMFFLLMVILATRAAAHAGPLDLDANGLPQGLYRKEISESQIQEVHDLFPEQSEANPLFIDPGLDPNLHIQQDAVVSLTFIDEGAGYWNSFGYFLYDENEVVLKEQILFGNASHVGKGGHMSPGDTIDIGNLYSEDGTPEPFPEGTNMGFFVEANGWGNPIYSNVDNHRFYTLDSLNPDGQRHVAMVYSHWSQSIIVGIEDVWLSYSDKDYNDMLFTFTTDPLSALVEIVEEGNIPDAEPVPEPGTMLLFGTGLSALAVSRRKKRNLKQ